MTWSDSALSEIHFVKTLFVFFIVVMGSESLMILYEDNSVEVHYPDGSRLLLSPCGSEFLFEKAVPPSAHPVQPPERVRQRTPFAISLYREQLLRAIDFRNQYSERPYLPSDIIPPEKKHVIFTDVTEAQWPGLHAANEEMCLLNGNVKVTSLDGHASLLLPELQQEFTVEFLCKAARDKNEGRSLPLSCHAPFLHRWVFTDFFEQKQEEDGYHSYSQPIKVLWSKGIIYRFSLGLRSIEIYPGDGSVFKSGGFFFGKYFTRYCINQQTKQREETMYSVSGLPPNVPGSLYSVRTIITQSVRVLQHDLENMLSLTHNYNVCCWKLSSETGGRTVLPLPVAETFVSNVGRFFAYSDKKVYAIFCDGTVLNMEWDFSFHSGRSQNPQENNAGWCKLTCPEGAQQLFQIDHPGPYERYITTVVEWCKSLNKDKGSCINTKEFIEEQSWSVAAELEKIRRFNFLVENSNIPARWPAQKAPRALPMNERLFGPAGGEWGAGTVAGSGGSRERASNPSPEAGIPLGNPEGHRGWGRTSCERTPGWRRGVSWARGKDARSVASVALGQCLFPPGGEREALPFFKAETQQAKTSLRSAARERRGWAVFSHVFPAPSRLRPCIFGTCIKPRQLSSWPI
ncbi:putative protein C5orf34 like [Crotalus adamanteus]|uniref:DUF4524 domain-containing protein n=1 Tax=Crotalus adamanteus TaxID=8729 RepID=A0AAW1C3V4_CROAD